MPTPCDVHILISELNNRIQYTFRHVFSKMMGVRPVFTNDNEAFANYQGPKLNYSLTRLADEIYIKPYGLLYGKGVRDKGMQLEIKEGQPFYLNDVGSDLPFDVFSAIFFMITRYEEYCRFKPDAHDRFEASESLAFKNGFLEEPVVELWVEKVKSIFKQKYPSIAFSEPQFLHIPTVDVDSAFAYLHKGNLRVVAATVKNFFKQDYEEMSRRFQTLSGRIPDMFDNFKYLESLLSGNDLKPIFFFLSGIYNRYDKNISLQKKAMRSIISNVSAFARVGLHPSYASNHEKYLFAIEKNRLEKCLNTPIEKSRQHYLKLKFPATYQNLIKHGIHEDYSMGYASRPGFRAGTCTPYNFYDLSREKETTLKIFPFQTMDNTFISYLNQPPEEAQEKILDLLRKVKKVGGTFISLWHNDTFAPTDKGMRWRKVFENVLKAE